MLSGPGNLNRFLPKPACPCEVIDSTRVTPDQAPVTVTEQAAEGGQDNLETAQKETPDRAEDSRTSRSEGGDGGETTEAYPGVENFLPVVKLSVVEVEKEAAQEIEYNR